MIRRIVPALLATSLSACNGAPASSPAATSLVPAVAPASSAAASIVVNPSKRGAVVSSLVLGANMATWYDITQPDLIPAFRTAGMASARWPGGSESDNFHWQTNSLGSGNCGAGYVNPNSTFDNFIKDIAKRGKLDVAITVNYGSNPACDAGADPTEAAGWVAYANKKKKLGIKWWSVGNEEYGSWETDLHSEPHDPSQYAQNVANDFYPKMKAASPSPINVCVDVDPQTSGWDSTVLANAKYDCVELHYYPQGTTVDDQFLIEKAAPKLNQYLGALKADLKTAGRADTPIYVGELGSTYGTPGKQTSSITQALYAAQVIGQLVENGVTRATWWLGYGGCDSESDGGDFDSSLYGWQDFGGFMVFSDGTIQENCSSENVPRGTVLPTGRAFEVASNFVRDGEHVLGVSVKSAPHVRAFASTYDGGYALLLINLDKNAAIHVPISIAGVGSGSGGTMVVYDKSLYDASKNNVWKKPVTSTLPAWNNSFTVTLPAWSITAVRTK
ncbi:MAG TPA: hypothetical protein VGK84_09415 [Candidatus Tumulicola sp.]